MLNIIILYLGDYILKIRNYLTLVKYLSTSVVIYFYILVAIYLLVEFLKLDKVLTYVIIYVTAYIVEYILTLRFVFHGQHRWQKMAKYISYIIIFLGLSTVLYRFFLSIGIYYLLATLLTAGMLMPIRFMINKYWVYR